MTVVYPINIRFPMERANSVQIAHTCRALAEHGVRVYLLVRRTTSMPDEQILAHYGLKPHPNLLIKRIWVINYDDHPFIWNKSFYVMVLLYIVGLLCVRKINWFFLRDLGIARFLAPLKLIFRFRMMYETHLISYIIAQEQHKLFPATAPVTTRLIEKIRRKEEYVFAQSDRIVVITNRLKECVSELFGCPEKKIYVLPDGVDTSLYKNIPPAQRSGLVYIGQLYPWKGVDTLIEAMQYIDAPLTVVGGIPFEDDLKRIKKKAGELGVAGKINFVGFVPHSEVAGYLTAAQISVIPLPDNIIARDYTSPLKLFESMGAGTAVVASDLPSIREIIRDRENGMLFTPHDPKSLAKAVTALLTDRSLLESVTRQARADVKQFSWEKRTARLIDICQH